MSEENVKAPVAETAPAASTESGELTVSKNSKKKHQKGSAKQQQQQQQQEESKSAVPVTNGDLAGDGGGDGATEERVPGREGASAKAKNKKKKCKAAPTEQGSVSEAATSSTSEQINGEQPGQADAGQDGGDQADVMMSMREMLKHINISALSNLKPAKTPEEALHKSYKFWSTQPVPRMDEKIMANEAIEEDKPLSEIRQEPYALPDGFTWDTMNLNDPLQLKELYTLLNENYVEDDDAMFRFDYQPEFLQWALQPPGWKRDWHCGVRVVKSGRLVGFISAIPGTLNVHRKEQRMVEINFLCVHKKLRSKRLAPVLIREITRRVNLTGIFQAVYTAGVVLPKPVSSCRYWHRSLNPKKLIEVKFSYLSRNMTMQRTIKLYKLPDQPKTPGFRKLNEADLKAVHKLLESYLQRFNLTPAFDETEMRHWFLPQNGIIDCFVVEDPARPGTITDMVSYYTLPSTVMHHAVHKYVKAAYSFYNVSTRTPWLDLMNDALISAKNLGFDVFNALDLMDNKQFLTPLKFGIGDGNLQYYLYNWRCPYMQPEDVGLILL
ncbi:glycylpeptide N-tetradecanoyltransferase [Anopheles maculipalpis]|uniref:glycylpeptide N-tetradecanoyltransferase n=1 Tax=Anopheles maculipalpis TaxID=1496333 RepID=UPI002159B204|nr:glycylpeptide N-tetradecanoyltransferase [Anopheles maculipalpis]